LSHHRTSKKKKDPSEGGPGKKKLNRGPLGDKMGGRGVKGVCRAKKNFSNPSRFGLKGAKRLEKYQKRGEAGG